jgi:hypothetical protein
MKSPLTIIIVSVIVMLLGSSLYLSWRESQEHDYNRNKDWWSVQFVDPKSIETHDFVIENYSASDVFSYTISSNDEILQNETLTVANNSSVTTPISIDLNNSSDIQIQITRDNQSTSRKTLSKKF